MTSVSASNEASVSSEKSEPGTLSSVPSACGTRTNSAWPPSSVPPPPKKPPWMQAVWKPAWQFWQVPSLNENGEMTKSPTLRSLTSSPISSTTPMNSCPTVPWFQSEMPRYHHRSDPQTQARTTRRTASVGSETVGLGMSSTTMLPVPLKIAAFITALL